MKKLDIPTYDDTQIIRDLSENSRLSGTSYPHLRNELTLIRAAYTDYVTQTGNAWNITDVLISDSLKTGLVKNYNDPPKLLSFIKELRDSSPDICPMCGSAKTGTLDHLLPKDNYPQWSVFSKNLVPACDCNLKRKEVLKGDVIKQERVLHPYFDNCMADRQLSCLITSTDNFRVVDIQISYVNRAEPQLDSIKFHVEKVIKPSGVIKWLENEWLKIRKRPSNQIQTIPLNSFNSIDELRGYLHDSLTRHDASKGTPNNWNSILIHGIMNSPGVVEWLLDRHNGIIDGSIDPLVD